MHQIIHQEAPSVQPTTIIKKNQDDFKNFNDDPIGHPKNLAQVNPYVTSNTAYGGQRKKEEWGVGNCIKGEPTIQQAQPDIDLG